MNSPGFVNHPIAKLALEVVAADATEPKLDERGEWMLRRSFGGFVKSGEKNEAAAALIAVAHFFETKFSGCDAAQKIKRIVASAASDSVSR